MAQKEAILLDPVYTGKTMSGMIDLIRKGYFNQDDNILFIHTGVSTANFAYENVLHENLIETPII